MEVTYNTVFYLYSTIPQVLAGAIALVGVFAIFRIGQLQTNLSGTAQSIYDIVQHISGTEEFVEFKYAYIYKEYYKLEKSIRKLNEHIATRKGPDSVVGNKTVLINYEAIFRRNNLVIKEIRYFTIFTTIYTAFIIMGSLWVLSKAETIACLENIREIYGITLFLVSVSIISMVAIIARSLSFK